MPGTRYRALPRTVYDFSSLTANAVANLVVAKGLDVSQYSSMDMIFRLHWTNISGSGVGATIKLVAYTEAPTDEDPGLEFVCSGLAATTSTISISTGTLVPQTLFVTQDGSTGSSTLGASIRLVLVAQQAAAPLLTTFQIAVSADLVPKAT